MTRISSYGIFVFAALFLLTTIGCEPDDPEFGDLTLNFTNLEDLGPDYVYEGWVMVNAVPVSTGAFTVNASGVASQTAFTVGFRDLQDAAAFVLTIEPANDTDPAPSGVNLMYGDFSGTAATLSTDASVGDFSTSSGSYILATPTNGPSSSELAGVWFLDNSSGTAVAGLDLPTLSSDAWTYEGWVIVDNTPISTGTFRDPNGADSGNPYSATANPAPLFPGEDFLIDLPAPLTLPVNLSGTTMAISVEPVPDNDTAPFMLKPLLGVTPAPATDGVVYGMDNGNLVNFPSGTATR